jgi:hypothetical protein
MKIQLKPIAMALFAAGIAGAAHAETVRFATFNASLNRDAAGQLLSDLANPLATGVTPPSPTASSRRTTWPKSRSA